MKGMEVFDRLVIFWIVGSISGAIGMYLRGYPEVSGNVLLLVALGLLGFVIVMALGELIIRFRQLQGEAA